jgi:hypothetical protein
VELQEIIEEAFEEEDSGDEVLLGGERALHKDEIRNLRT